MVRCPSARCRESPGRSRWRPAKTNPPKRCEFLLLRRSAIAVFRSGRGEAGDWPFRSRAQSLPERWPAQSKCPAPTGCVPATGFFVGGILCSLWSIREQLFDSNTYAALLQPLVCLLVDGLLHQRFLNEVTRGFQRRRSLSARLS